MENYLNEFIDELIQEVEQELEEATTTGNVAGYNTPFAFGTNRKKDKKKEKETATQAGYTLAEAITKISSSNFKKLEDGIKKINPRIKISLNSSAPGGFEIQIPDDSKWELHTDKVQQLTTKITGDHRNGRIFYEGINESVNEAELKLGVKYVNKQGKEGFIQTGGSKNPKDWFWFDGKTKHPYTKVKKELKPSKDKKKTGFGDYLKQGGRVWDNVNPSDSTSVNEAKVKRPVNRWLELKNDDTMHPHKKMAMGLKELKYQLREVEKFFSWYNKIKTMNELDSQNYWKRTNNHIYKIKERLINIAKTIKEIEK